MPEPLDLAGRRVAHLCVDMQLMYAEDTEWRTPWMDRVLPAIETIVRRRPGDTIFTRFMPPRTPDRAPGAWAAYFERWRCFTQDRADPAIYGILPSLAALAPEAEIIDKPAFSPFHASRLDDALRARNADTLVITGAETDMCVLAAVMSAVDRGYYVVLPKDGLCSSADETHDALLTLYAKRFSQQVALSDARTILAAWP